MQLDLLPTDGLVPLHNAKQDHARQEKDFLKKYWQILLRYKWALLGIIAGFVICSALVSLSMAPSYQAKAVLELESAASSEQFGQHSVSTDPVSTQSFDTYLDNQMGILQSDNLIRKTVTKIHLAERLQAVHPTGLVALRKSIGLGRQPKIVTPEIAFEVAKANLIVRQSRQNSLIEVLFSAGDPTTAAAFVNALVEEYSEQNMQARWEVAQRVEQWLTKQMVVLRTKLENSEAALQTYSSSTHLMPLSDEESLSTAKLRQIQAELFTAEEDCIRKRSQMDLVAHGSLEASPQLLDSAVFQSYQIKVADLKRELAESSQIYTPTSPKRKLLQAQIDELEHAMDQQREMVADRLQKEYDSANHQRQSLEAAFAWQSQVVTQENENMIRFNTLKHEVDTNRAIYESVLQKIKEAGVAAALQSDTVRIVDPGVAPAAPYKPKHLLNVGAGALVGLIAGLIFVAFAYGRDSRILSLDLHPSFKALGIVPAVPSIYDGLLEQARQLERSNPATLTSIDMYRSKIGALMRPKEIERSKRLGSRDVAQDYIRGVMMSILHAGIGEGSRKVVVVTSPRSAEGKTTIAIYLAEALAETGRNVLIVDADVRRPRLHEVLNTSQEPGLQEFASKERAESGRPDVYIRSTSLPNLSLLPSGRFVEGNRNPLYSRNFAGVINALRADYDAIIMDAPPVLGVPETRILARLADGVVLVLREKISVAEEASEAWRQIQQDGGTLLGAVLNDAVPENLPYYPERISHEAAG